MLIFWWLIVGHFVVDYPLQGDTTAREKNRHSTTALQSYVPWYYWMLSHSLMQGGVVVLVTGNLALGIAESVLHFLIDFGKCDNWFNIHIDQLLHISCKLLWVLIYHV